MTRRETESSLAAEPGEKGWCRRDTRTETLSQAHERLYRIPVHRRPGFAPGPPSALHGSGVTMRKSSRLPFGPADFHINCGKTIGRSKSKKEGTENNFLQGGGMLGASRGSSSRNLLQQREAYLRPEPDISLTRKNLAAFFADKIEDGYRWEPTKVVGPRPTGKGRESEWDKKARPWKGKGYTGDFHDPVSNPGFGRAPYGGIFTNFR